MSNQCLRLKKPTAGPPPRALPAGRLDVREIARLASRLSPTHGDPERFYIHREEVVHRLYALARELEAGR